MSIKRYVARELLEQHTKQKKQAKLEQRRLALEQRAKYKKQNKILLVFLLILFVPPLLLFPAFPKIYGSMKFIATSLKACLSLLELKALCHFLLFFPVFMSLS